MKLLKKSRTVVHSLVESVQARIACVSNSVVGVSLAAGAGSRWIDEHAKAAPKQRPAPLPEGYVPPE